MFYVSTGPNDSPLPVSSTPPSRQGHTTPAPIHVVLVRAWDTPAPSGGLAVAARVGGERSGVVRDAPKGVGPGRREQGGGPAYHRRQRGTGEAAPQWLALHVTCVLHVGAKGTGVSEVPACVVVYRFNVLAWR